MAENKKNHVGGHDWVGLLALGATLLIAVVGVYVRLEVAVGKLDTKVDHLQGSDAKHDGAIDKECESNKALSIQLGKIEERIVAAKEQLDRLTSRTATSATMSHCVQFCSNMSLAHDLAPLTEWIKKNPESELANQIDSYRKSMAPFLLFFNGDSTEDKEITDHIGEIESIPIATITLSTNRDLARSMGVSITPTFMFVDRGRIEYVWTDVDSIGTLNEKWETATRILRGDFPEPTPAPPQ